jgi:hypothetical protein
MGVIGDIRVIRGSEFKAKQGLTADLR